MNEIQPNEPIEWSDQCERCWAWGENSTVAERSDGAWLCDKCTVARKTPESGASFREKLELLGELRDSYERSQVAMCKADPGNEKLVELTFKHLAARRQRVAN